MGPRETITLASHAPNLRDYICNKNLWAIISQLISILAQQGTNMRDPLLDEMGLVLLNTQHNIFSGGCQGMDSS